MSPFEHPEYFSLLAVLPVLLLLFGWALRRRRRRLQRLGEPALLSRLMPDFSPRRPLLKFGLLLGVIALVVLALANPQQGTKRKTITRKGIDLFLALDVSNSMLAEDTRPNRLERARKLCSDLLEQLQGNRIGLIVFAGNAYLHMPLTLDYSAARVFLKSINPEQVPTQGTALAEAIRLAELSFPQDNENHKVLVLITDGEDHQEEALEAAHQAYSSHLLIYTVGVGSPEGSLIPIRVGNRTEFKRDAQGNPVRSRLNEELLQKIAAEAGGRYFHITQAERLGAELLEHIDRLEKQEYQSLEFEEKESYFQYFLGVALLLLIVEFFIPFTRNPHRSNRDWFD